MTRFEPTDFKWSVIQPVLPTRGRGKPRVDNRWVLNGIFRRPRPGGAREAPPTSHHPRRGLRPGFRLQ